MKRRGGAVLCALVFGVISVIASTAAFATNGMDLEGYGPIATGMGGASMAYDNGTAAMMNNPATLGLMRQGNRLDVALGYLGPHVTASIPGEEAGSSGRSYYMPALGWMQKNGPMAYGIGVFSQGGMGTEYSKDSFLAAGSGEKVRSELGVGRVIFPFAYKVNKELSVAATVDYVWASLDLKMALPGSAFLDMAPGGSQTFGTVSGSMMTAFNSAVAFGVISNGMFGNPMPVNWGRFDFSDSSPFTGKAKSEGVAGKVGAVYKVSSDVSIGLTYHSKTWLGDMEATGAKVTFNANVDNNILNGTWNPGVSGSPAGTYSAITIPITGKIRVKDFQWPQTIGAGVAYKATPALLIVFDYKWINWADVMKDFKLAFTADPNQPGLAGGFSNTEIDATLFQKWKDQHVFMLGAAYKVSPEWTLRAGFNYANNPIPDSYLNDLFPAIEKSHVTIGAGYMITKASSVDASFTYAPEVKQTSDQGVEMKHYQTNAQLMYSYRF